MPTQLPLVADEAAARKHLRYLFTEPPGDEDVRKYIHGDAEGFLLGNSFTEDECTSIPLNECTSIPLNEAFKTRDGRAIQISPSDRAYSSFGDDGTIASVNVVGNIVQISRFLGAGRSGFISVEIDNGGFRFDSIPASRPSTRGCKEPFGIFEGPADQLITPESGIGLRVTDVDFEEEMEMVFIRDRWPRFKYGSEEWPFSLQYFVRNGIVIQNYVIHRPPEKQQADESEGKKSTQPQWPKLEIHTNLLISDPGWEEYWYFDEALQKHTIVVFFRTPRSTENKLVGLVIAPFVNGKVASLRKVGKTEMEKKDGREYYILLPEGVEKDPTRLEVTI